MGLFWKTPTSFSQIVPYIPQQTQQPKKFHLTKNNFISNAKNQRLI